MSTLKLLVLDGNTAEVNARHAAFGGTATGEHYDKVLRSLRGDVECIVLHPADPGGDRLPGGLSLDAFDGLVWTGSALNVYRDCPAVAAQVALARAGFESGVPMFGSCWGLQVAAAAAGGEVRANPRGRELGIARRIALSPSGATHPMFEGKAPVFDAISVHQDEVVTLPPGTTVLASNAMSRVQAAEIVRGKGRFWGVQYHPEYDLNEIATVMLRYGVRLVDEGFFADLPALERFVKDCRALDEDPAGRRDLAWLYGLGPEVIDPALRRRELSNWLDRVVAPHAAGRGRG